MFIRLFNDVFEVTIAQIKPIALSMYCIFSTFPTLRVYILVNNTLVR